MTLASERLARLRLGLCLLATAAGASTATAAEPVLPPNTRDTPWLLTVASEVRYFSWKGSSGTPSGINGFPGRGTQIYIPYAAQLVGEPNEDWKLELLGRGGWIHARQSTAGLAGEVETATDTVAAGTLTYRGFAGLQPFVSVSTNLPTGRSVLFGAAANARMDPDMVEIGSFGEGFNIGPTLGFNLLFSPSFVLTASVGYTWRGPFDRENSLTPANANQAPSDAQILTGINPGNVLTGTMGLSYKDGPWAASVTGAISEETTSTETGTALYKAGRRYLGSATLAYSWPQDIGVTTLAAAAAHANRNDVLFLGASALITEPLNTNANVYRAGLQHLVPFDALWIGPTGSVLYRDNNSYDSMTLQFVPAKRRYAAGGVMQYAASDKISFNARAEHVWTHEGDRPSANGEKFSVLANDFVPGSAVPVVTGRGWQISTGLNIQF